MVEIHTSLSAQYFLLHDLSSTWLAAEDLFKGGPHDWDADIGNWLSCEETRWNVRNRLCSATSKGLAGKF